MLLALAALLLAAPAFAMRRHRVEHGGAGAGAHEAEHAHRLHQKNMHERIHGHQGQGLSHQEKQAAMISPLFLVCVVGPWALACNWLCQKQVQQKIDRIETKLR